MKKIFTEELTNKLREHFSSKDVLDLVTKMKGAKDTGTFEMIISSEHVDRSGEIVLQDGIDTSYYLKNPIVLQFHNYYEMPIGVTDSLEIRVIEGIKCTIAKGRFAPTEDGQEARTLYEAKMLNTASIGFIPKLWGENNTIVQCQLLEWSFVPVPCNPEAITMLNLDFEKLVKKGIIIKNEETPAEPAIISEDVVEENAETNVEEATPQADEKKPDAEDVVLPENQGEDNRVADEKAIIKDNTKNTRISNISMKIETLEALIKDIKYDLEKDTNEIIDTPTDVDVPIVDDKKNHAPFDKKAYEDYLSIRQIMRNVNNLTSKGLEKINRNLKKNISK